MYLSQPANLEDIAFSTFMFQYQKKYSTIQEREIRKAIFLENSRKIEQINKEGHPFTLGINKFADLTEEEFAKYYLTENPVPKEIVDQEYDPPASIGEYDDDVIDWVEKDKVTPVKDQGMCGSCWTFGSTSVAETFFAIKNGTLLEFSEQQLVDCCITDNSKGCSGGEVEDALDYFKDKNNMLAKDYPYMALDRDCKYKQEKAQYHALDGFTAITSGDTEEMQKVLMTRTMYISVNAGAFAFRFYKSGIITEGCPHHTLGHGVTLVGSGEENGVKFWRVRNSWGSNWGDKGYLKILRTLGTGVPGVCGIGRHAVYAKLNNE